MIKLVRFAALADFFQLLGDIVHTPQITAETRQLWNQGVAERVSIGARLERL